MASGAARGRVVVVHGLLEESPNPRIQLNEHAAASGGAGMVDGGVEGRGTLLASRDRLLESALFAAGVQGRGRCARPQPSRWTAPHSEAASPLRAGLKVLSAAVPRHVPPGNAPFPRVRTPPVLESDGVMAGRHGQSPPELREPAVRLVAECRPDHAWKWEAMRSVAQKLGIGTTETVRQWVRRGEVHAAPAQG